MQLEPYHTETTEKKIKLYPKAQKLKPTPQTCYNKLSAKKIKIKRYIQCDDCQGSGAQSGSGTNTCLACGGTGEMRHVSRSIFGQIVNVTICNVCGGEGKVIKEKCNKDKSWTISHGRDQFG